MKNTVDTYKQRAWDVIKVNGSKWQTIDTVFFNNDMDADEVKRSLVEHDGYDSDIRVFQRD